MTVETRYEHIVRSPDILGGKPRIDGRRISVQHVAVLHDHLGYSVDEIATEFELTLAEVYSALAYYHDHRDEIDRQLAEGEALSETLRRQTPSLLAQKLYGRAD
jgi:uncharacterized protein (DUF433 family)